VTPQLRAALEKAIAATNKTRVAWQIGIGEAELRRAMRGEASVSAIAWTKLTAWYERRGRKQ
jgi:hypothetical protein